MEDDTVACDCIACQIDSNQSDGDMAYNRSRGNRDMPYFEPNPTSGKPGYRTPKSGKAGGVNSGVPKGERVKAPKVNVPPTVRTPKSPGTTNK